MNFSALSEYITSRVQGLCLNQSYINLILSFVPMPRDKGRNDVRSDELRVYCPEAADKWVMDTL